MIQPPLNSGGYVAAPDKAWFLLKDCLGEATVGVPPSGGPEKAG
jgi:hypothetical protein